MIIPVDTDTCNLAQFLAVLNQVKLDILTSEQTEELKKELLTRTVVTLSNSVDDSNKRLSNLLNAVFLKSSEE